MRKLLIIFLLVSHFLAFTQSKPIKTNKEPRKQESVTGKKKYGGATTQAVFDSLKHDICINKQFSIVFYIVIDSLDPNDPTYNGRGYATQDNIDTLIKYVNRAFKPICVSFASCSTVIIPNYTYGKSWIKKFQNYAPIEEYVTAGYYTDKTINFYLVDTIYFPSIDPERKGYTYQPTTANLAAPKRDILVMEKSDLLQSYSSAANHLFGHYFGLPNTFDEINPTPVATPPPVPPVVSQEFVDGSNCYTHGDGFCDTDADPENSIIVHGTVDGMGNYYLLPIDNFMSYYTARSRFTQEQYNRMAYHIMYSRLYLH